MVLRGSSASGRTCVSWVILGLLVVLILVGVVSGGAYLYLRFNRPPGLDNPVGQLREDKVDASLALSTLAGAKDLEVVTRALRAEELETAYATIVFSTELADRERLGSLLLLAHAYAAAGDSSRAQLCYQQGNLIATLSPTLSDFAKTNAYLEIGGGLAELGNTAEALSNYDQAYVVALHSQYMRDPHRADALGELAAAYQALGKSAEANDCLTLQAAIQYVYEESGASSEEASESPPEQAGTPFVMQIPEPTEAMIASYEQRRVETVQQLIHLLQEASEGASLAEDSMADVTQALLNEDEARRGVYEEQLAGASSIVLKIGVAKARVDWLVLKYRIALGGYGLQLVPAWADGLADIEAELNAAYTGLLGAYDEQIRTFSDDVAVDRAWFHLVRFQIEQGGLGLYPDYPEEDLLSQLEEVTERLIASGNLSLHVAVAYEGDNPVFTLATVE